jgi:hypothetical protein
MQSGLLEWRLDMNRMRGRDAIYWLTTAAVCGVMAFSAVNFNLKEPLGPMKDAFVHLGYPEYFRIEQTRRRSWACSPC